MAEELGAAEASVAIIIRAEMPEGTEPEADSKTRLRGSNPDSQLRSQVNLGIRHPGTRFSHLLNGKVGVFLRMSVNKCCACFT